MRIAQSLTLPPELERARAAGELVVFAGAGVSMGPPANLPGFRGLARQIAEPKVPWDDSYALALDRYLGRAEREGVKVQERARAFLSVGGSHTPLHEHLVGIFGAAERVRLITTNFDPHFSTAASGVFPNSSIPHYVGPALPPGRSFSGIAQLHGALDHRQDRLVLTDRDFADAYMAEGWAARFLVRVFADRTVLFVGYSLGDPLMQYLLHALPPTGRWYALWHESELTQGAEHPIIGVPFHTAENGDRFGDLNNGLQRWHWYASAPPSDHDRELRRLISLGPPASPLDADYLRARLSTDVGRTVFWSTATDPKWFEWAAAEGFLNGLTDDRSPDPLIAPWGRWCVDNFCSGDRPALLRFLRGRPLTLHPWFRDELILHLWRCEVLPPRPVLRQLIALIVGQATSSALDSHAWEWLLTRLVRDGCREEALALLRAATRVHLQPLEHLHLAFEAAAERKDGEADKKEELPSLSIRIGTLVASTELAEFLDQRGADLAAQVADELLLLGEQRIREAYELLDLARGATGDIDWLSYGRTAISPSGQDSMPHAEDVLVSLVRLTLDHWADAAPAKLRSYAERNDRSTRNLLRRLALYAYARCAGCSSDEILVRATAQGWARDLWGRPEFYQVLGAHYRRASEGVRQEFVAALRDDSWWGEEFDEHTAHARFSLSQKLIREAPDSDATKTFAEAEKIAHPDWAEGDRDGYLSRIEMRWGGEEPSPVGAEQMLEWTPADALTRVREELTEEVSTGRRQALLGAAQQAVRSNPQWGIELFALAMNGDAASQGIAEAMLWGLWDAPVSAADQQNLVRKIAVEEWAQGLTGPISSLLGKWSDNLGRAADPELLHQMDAAADLIYERSRSEVPGIVDQGWTERSINHPAGRAARIWWHTAIARDWVNDEFVLTLDDAEKERWEKVARDDSGAGAYARPILGMVTERLTAGDYPWATTTIFSAFDATLANDRAAQLWDGRLTQSRWSWSTVEALHPYLDSLFTESATLIPARSRELGDWVAMLVVDAEKTQLRGARLQRFVQHATDEARLAFAEALPRHLAPLAPEARQRLWRDTLLPYWNDRRTNMPLPLAPNEVRAMISWVAALPEVAGEVLAALRVSPGEQLAHADHVIWEWKEDDTWVRAHPAEAVGVVEFLAERRSLSTWLTDDAVVVLDRALEAGAPREQVLQAAERLVALSPPASATSLVARLRVES